MAVIAWQETVDDKDTKEMVREWFFKGHAALSFGNYDEAIKCYKKTLELNPGFTYAHRFIGDVYFKKENINDAISEYKKALAINPNYAEVHYNLEVAYFKKGNYKLAIAHCDRALELGYSVNPKVLQLLKPYR